ncbi:MAG: carboxylate-amine ligase [Deltaproteobacteria bacterium]|nr:carboxylate-amine ligase [Deltaproteobacteria bacterium]
MAGKGDRLENDIKATPATVEHTPVRLKSPQKIQTPDHELKKFVELQAGFGETYGRLMADPNAPRTVLVVPSLSLDEDVLQKISGVLHYEERMLCMLMLLRQPRTHVIYLTSQPIESTIIDYHLHLMPGIPVSHAKNRLTLMSAHDGSMTCLTQKVLQRPRMMNRLRDRIRDPNSAYISCFNSTPAERALAVALGLPLYACDPALAHLGTKSGSRKVFREAGVPMPDGVEDLRDERDLVQGIAELRRRNECVERVAIKLNEGFSGEGNATFSLKGCPTNGELETWIRDSLPSGILCEASGESWEIFKEKLREMGGVVEHYIESEEKRSPSVQARIDPLGCEHIISTHDQILGGPSGQIYLGSTFPADQAYRLQIQEMGLRVSQVLRQYGVLGRFGIDFIVVREGEHWRPYAIEINLRKGGTTHTYMQLQHLTDGEYDPDSGLYVTPRGQPRYYYASDNLQKASYKGLTPEDLIDISVQHQLHFHGATQQGVVFHLIGAFSEFGKIGVLCIGDSYQRAHEFYRETVSVLDRETGPGEKR